MPSLKNNRSRPRSSVRILASLVVFLLGQVPGLATAEWKPPQNIAGPVECDAEAPAHCSAPIRPNQRAPFRGQVITTELSITLGQKAFYCDDRIELEVSRTAITAVANKKADRRVWEAELKAERSKAYLAGKEAAAPGCFERPPFWFGVGIGAAAVIFFSVKAGDKAIDKAFQ